jgi:hypothetical protein
MIKATTPLEQLMSKLEARMATMPTPTYDCAICEDTGVEYVQLANGHEAIRDCVCFLRKRLREIPCEYREVTLMALSPQRDSEKEKDVINEIQKNPFGSYVFATKSEAHKCFAWALWRNALESRRRSVAVQLHELLLAYKSGESSLIPETLQQKHTRYSILLEVGKVKLTDYTGRRLFEFLKAARDYDHQLIILTEVDYEDLKKHFDKEDEVWGRLIVRELERETKLIELS